LVDDNGKACVADLGLSSSVIPQVETAVTRKIQFEYEIALRGVVPKSMRTTISSTAASSTLGSLSGAGTFRWMSPERLIPEQYGQKSAKPTFQSDVFSFGMLIYQVRDIRSSFVAILRGVRIGV
jgi:serine/threonine protein kinase